MGVLLVVDSSAGDTLEPLMLIKKVALGLLQNGWLSGCIPLAIRE